MLAFVDRYMHSIFLNTQYLFLSCDTHWVSWEKIPSRYLCHLCKGWALPYTLDGISLDRVVHDHLHIGKFQTEHDIALIILKLMMAHMYVNLHTHTHTHNETHTYKRIVQWPHEVLFYSHEQSLDHNAFYQYFLTQFC